MIDAQDVDVPGNLTMVSSTATEGIRARMEALERRLGN
jgi:hypothetical protein